MEWGHDDGGEGRGGGGRAKGKQTKTYLRARTWWWTNRSVLPWLRSVACGVVGVGGWVVRRPRAQKLFVFGVGDDDDMRGGDGPPEDACGLDDHCAL